MRLLLLALALVSAPALAQGAEPDSADADSRFSLSTRAGLVVSDVAVPAGFVGVTGAYRVAPGTALTLSADGGDLGPGRGLFASFGPGVTYSKSLDDRSTFASSADLRFTRSQSDLSLQHRGTTAVGTMGIDRAIPIVGSVEIVPTLGAYAAVGQWAEEVNARGDSLGGAHASAGMLIGARVRFSAFGRKFEIPLVVPVEAYGRGQSAFPLYAQTQQLTDADVRAFVASSRLMQGADGPQLSVRDRRKRR